MYIKKGYFLIGIGIILVLFCSRNIFIMPHVFDNDLTLLEYELVNDLDINELKEEILDNVTLDLDLISITQEDNRVKIELNLMEKNELKLIETHISQTYGENMQFSSSYIMGSIETSKTYYTIMIVLTILLLIGGTLIIKGILMLKKEKEKLKVQTTQ